MDHNEIEKCLFVISQLCQGGTLLWKIVTKRHETDELCCQNSEISVNNTQAI